MRKSGIQGQPLLHTLSRGSGIGKGDMPVDPQTICRLDARGQRLLVVRDRCKQSAGTRPQFRDLSNCANVPEWHNPQLQWGAGAGAGSSPPVERQVTSWRCMVRGKITYRPFQDTSSANRAPNQPDLAFANHLVHARENRQLQPHPACCLDDDRGRISNRDDGIEGTRSRHRPTYTCYTLSL